MTRVLVTGATGFVGQVLCTVLSEGGYRVRAALRADAPVVAGVDENAIVGDIGGNGSWVAALTEVDSVVHLAAKAHAVHGADPESYMATNAQATLRLAQAAADAGVRRFVYLSSVKVNGEGNVGRAYTSADEPRPADVYGTSKWLGEQALLRIATSSSSIEPVIVRSPLVYGPGVRANFLRLLRWVDSGWPLPLAAIRNRRSLVSVWNLCNLLLRVLKSAQAPGRTWMVSDGEDLSTPDLVARLGAAMGRRVKLVGVPVAALRLGGALTGRKAEVDRLCESLAVDVTQTREQLGWSPPLTVDEGLVRTVTWYMSKGRTGDDR